MNRYVLFFGIVLALILSGCSNDNETKIDEKNTDKSEQTTHEVPKKNEKVSLAKTEKQVDTQLTKVLKSSLKNQDKKAFLGLFNKENKVFYKEQERWFEEYIYMLKDDYKIEATIEDVMLTSSEKGQINFTVFIERSSGETLNASVTYGIKTTINDSKKWKIVGIPYKKMNDNLITVNYLEGEKQAASNILAHAKKVVGVYKNNFDWQLEGIHVKLFKSSNELVATIPFWTDKAVGWNEYYEAIKLVVNDNAKATQYVLEHEIAHQLLSDLTNDNCPIWFQEGFANFLPEGLIEKDGKLSFDKVKSNKASQSMIERLKGNESFPNISDISQEKYLDVYGYLFINYLIQEHSMDTFVEMLSDLKNNPYIDKRIGHKTKQMDKLLLETIEKHYGALEKLSEGYRGFYSSK